MIEKFLDDLETKEVPTPGPCFSFSAKSPDGMSGGPNFDQEGIYVHGMVSKGWEDETGLSKFSFGSMLAPSTTLPISKMGGASLAQLLAAGTEGMPQFGNRGL